MSPIIGIHTFSGNTVPTVYLYSMYSMVSVEVLYSTPVQLKQLKQLWKLRQRSRGGGFGGVEGGFEASRGFRGASASCALLAASPPRRLKPSSQRGYPGIHGMVLQCSSVPVFQCSSVPVWGARLFGRGFVQYCTATVEL